MWQRLRGSGQRWHSGGGAHRLLCYRSASHAVELLDGLCSLAALSTTTTDGNEQSCKLAMGDSGAGEICS